MKSASAMKYGGELVDAVDCDYDSFKELIPLCPNCKEPVFLRIGGQRESVKGKAYQIGPHWCHFKGISKEQVAGCELRVNGYTEQDRAKIANQARGQRLKLLQRWFWRCVASNIPKQLTGETESGFSSAIDAIHSGLTHRNPRLLLATKDLSSNLIKCAEKSELSKTKELIEKFVERISIESTTGATPLDGGLKLDLSPEEKDYVQSIAAPIQEIGTQLHCSICVEVLCFLVAKQNRNRLLSRFIEVALWTAILQYRHGEDVSGNEIAKNLTLQDLSWAFFTNLVTIPWASEFQRLETEAKQRKGAA